MHSKVKFHLSICRYIGKHQINYITEANQIHIQRSLDYFKQKYNHRVCESKKLGYLQTFYERVDKPFLYDFPNNCCYVDLLAAKIRYLITGVARSLNIFNGALCVSLVVLSANIVITFAAVAVLGMNLLLILTTIFLFYTNPSETLSFLSLIYNGKLS